MEPHCRALACDDGDPNTGGDSWDASCNCVGQLIDCEGNAGGGTALPGTAATTATPTLGRHRDASCNCVGLLIDCEGTLAGPHRRAPRATMATPTPG